MKGTIDRDGYRYFLFNRKGEPKRRISEQRLVWERVNGPIPSGMDIHHRDGNKLNNAINNLELIDRRKHVQMHRREIVGGYELRNNIWHKPCRECLEILPLDNFYSKSNSKHCWCKPCYNKKVVERKHRRLQNVNS